MDYKNFENELLKYYSDNLQSKAFAIDNNLIFDIVSKFGFPDSLDSGQVLFYILPIGYNFEPLSNNSFLMRLQAKYYLILKNIQAKNDIVKLYLREYVQAIEELTNYDTLDGVVDRAYNMATTFYDSVEGLGSAVAAELEIEIVKEI